jgi:hypothetical protein
MWYIIVGIIIVLLLPQIIGAILIAIDMIKERRA